MKGIKFNQNKKKMWIRVRVEDDSGLEPFVDRLCYK